jgi:hypothetical protein
MQSKSSSARSRTKAIEAAAPAFPYDLYKETKEWKIVEKAIQDLVENNDIAETTGRDYIVGYICKQLAML